MLQLDAKETNGRRGYNSMANKTDPTNPLSG
jgi:hypothetical protein